MRDTVAPAAGTLARVAEAVKPAVVNIKTQARGMTPGGHARAPGGRPPSEEFSPEDFMRRFFGGVPEPGPQRGLGSGVIIDGSGIALTNAHLVENATRIEVVTLEGDTYPAKVLGADTATDLAVLQLEGVKGPLPTVLLADSDTVRVGDWVLAVGSPFGLQSTVTIGIVSGKARHIGAGPFDDFLQTDAAINPGNSGGPLVNMGGQVVGINTAIVAGGSGIGFAIPSNMVKRIGQELREKGRVRRGWLGVSIQPLTPELAKSFGVKSEAGALIAKVQPDSPAGQAGLAAGDVVIELDGKPVKDPGDVQRGIGLAKPGTRTQLKAWRDGAERSVSVTLGEAPSASRRAEERPSPTPPTASGLGLGVRPLTPDLARELQTESQDGVVVAQVAPRSAAARAGIRPGDIVREVNRRPVKTVEDFERTTQRLKEGDVVSLRLERRGASRYVAITLGAA
ncbi:MAG: Do family serine endopeptidase [Candidatus Rokubacteria bacterium]|nr:Do family serine endopeptidase [Candidatus Rokubacteria bacterium]